MVNMEGRENQTRWKVKSPTARHVHGETCDLRYARLSSLEVRIVHFDLLIFTSPSDMAPTAVGLPPTHPYKTGGTTAYEILPSKARNEWLDGLQAKIDRALNPPPSPGPSRSPSPVRVTVGAEEQASSSAVISGYVQEDALSKNSQQLYDEDEDDYGEEADGYAQEASGSSERGELHLGRRTDVSPMPQVYDVEEVDDADEDDEDDEQDDWGDEEGEEGEDEMAERLEDGDDVGDSGDEEDESGEEEDQFGDEDDEVGDEEDELEDEDGIIPRTHELMGRPRDYSEADLQGEQIYVEDPQDDNEDRMEEGSYHLNGVTPNLDRTAPYNAAPFQGVRNARTAATVGDEEPMFIEGNAGLYDDLLEDETAGVSYDGSHDQQVMVDALAPPASANEPDLPLERHDDQNDFPVMTFEVVQSNTQFYDSGEGTSVHEEDEASQTVQSSEVNRWQYVGAMGDLVDGQREVPPTHPTSLAGTSALDSSLVQAVIQQFPSHHTQQVELLDVDTASPSHAGTNPISIYPPLPDVPATFDFGSRAPLSDEMIDPSLLADIAQMVEAVDSPIPAVSLDWQYVDLADDS